jgi:cell division septum initiation protein DivIVA
MSTVESEDEHVPNQLVDQLVKGYDALSTEIRILDEQRQELENKLTWAKQQVRSIHFPATSRPMMKFSISSRSAAACSSD